MTVRSRGVLAEPVSVCASRITPPRYERTRGRFRDATLALATLSTAAEQPDFVKLARGRLAKHSYISTAAGLFTAWRHDVNRAFTQRPGRCLALVAARS